MLYAIAMGQIKTVMGDVVAHVKPQKNSLFRQICRNVLFHHYIASRKLMVL